METIYLCFREKKLLPLFFYTTYILLEELLCDGNFSEIGRLFSEKHLMKLKACGGDLFSILMAIFSKKNLDLRKITAGKISYTVVNKFLERNYHKELYWFMCNTRRLDEMGLLYTAREFGPGFFDVILPFCSPDNLYRFLTEKRSRRFVTEIFLCLGDNLVGFAKNKLCAPSPINEYLVSKIPGTRRMRCICGFH